MVAPFIHHELYLIYDPETELGKKTYAMASSISGVIHEINVRKQAVTPLRWKELADLLGLQPLALLNHTNPNYQNLIGNDSYSEKDALEILNKNPELLAGPIGVYHGKAVLCNDPKDILRIGEPEVYKA